MGHLHKTHGEAVDGVNASWRELKEAEERSRITVGSYLKMLDTYWYAGDCRWGDSVKNTQGLAAVFFVATVCGFASILNEKKIKAYVKCFGRGTRVVLPPANNAKVHRQLPWHLFMVRKGQFSSNLRRGIESMFPII